MLDRIEKNQILSNKIGHQILLTARTFPGWKKQMEASIFLYCYVEEIWQTFKIFDWSSTGFKEQTGKEHLLKSKAQYN